VAESVPTVRAGITEEKSRRHSAMFLQLGLGRISAIVADFTLQGLFQARCQRWLLHGAPDEEQRD